MTSKIRQIVWQKSGIANSISIQVDAYKLSDYTILLRTYGSAYGRQFVHIGRVYWDQKIEFQLVSQNDSGIIYVSEGNEFNLWLVISPEYVGFVTRNKTKQLTDSELIASVRREQIQFQEYTNWQDQVVSTAHPTFTEINVDPNLGTLYGAQIWEDTAQDPGTCCLQLRRGNTIICCGNVDGLRAASLQNYNWVQIEQSTWVIESLIYRAFLTRVGDIWAIG